MSYVRERERERFRESSPQTAVSSVPPVRVATLGAVSCRFSAG